MTGPERAAPAVDSASVDPSPSVDPSAAVDLSVVVPAYNEERRLGPTLDAITTYLGDNEGRFGDWRSEEHTSELQSLV